LPAGQTQTLLPDDYLVSVEVPTDPVDGKPMYQVTREEDVNIFDGDAYLPQENFPPSQEQAATRPQGADRSRIPVRRRRRATASSPSGAGAKPHREGDRPDLCDGGGSPFEGQDRPLCDTKLVQVRGGQTSAPNFNLSPRYPCPPTLGPDHQRPGPVARQAEHRLR